MFYFIAHATKKEFRFWLLAQRIIKAGEMYRITDGFSMIEDYINNVNLFVCLTLPCITEYIAPNDRMIRALSRVVC
jgi:hypothetical protein